MAQLQEERAQRVRQVDVRRSRNVAARAAYEALRLQARLREAALRRLEEEARDLLEQLVQRKARAAAERNLRNERRERSGGWVPSPGREPLAPSPGRRTHALWGRGRRPAPVYQEVFLPPGPSRRWCPRS